MSVTPFVQDEDFTLYVGDAVRQPKCHVCGEPIELEQLKSMGEAAEGETVAVYRCPVGHGKQPSFSKPTQADIERGRELAERYGW